MPLEIADIRLWSGDLSFILDRLEELNRGKGIFSGKLDTGRTGVTGYSKGGAAAGQFCVSDNRCKAGINLSGFMFGDVIDSIITQPFMILENTVSWCEECNPICDIIYENSQNSAYIIQVEGAEHGNFCDWSLVGPFLRFIGMTGPIKGHHFLRIQNDYVLNFFNAHLKGIPSQLLNDPTGPYPEVRIKTKNSL